MRYLRQTLKALSPAIILVSVLCGIISGQSALTTIQDTLFDADGARYNGTLTIQWSTFDTTNPGTIIQQSQTVQVVNGNLLVQLAPNSTAPPPANVYTVLYQSDGDQQYTELWTVPPSTTPLTVPQVRTGTVAAGGGPAGLSGGTAVTESSVTNLVSDLNARPIKGPGFGTNAVAIVDQNGQIETAVGDPGDCVFVDGTSGPCSTGTTLPTFVTGETPGGAVNGINATFTLANTPSGSSLLLFRNGLLVQSGVDYTLSGSTIQFVSAGIPQPQDSLVAEYRIDPGTGSSGSGVATGPSGVPGVNGCGAAGAVSKSAAYQIQFADNGSLLIETADANFTLPVPVPATGWCVALLDTNSAAISVANNGNAINGVISVYSLQPANTIFVVSDGSGYWASGATGAPGPIGSTGVQGSTGPIGLTGPAGPTGAAGAAGAVGGAGASSILCNGSASATAPTCAGIPAPPNYGTSSAGYISGTFIAGASSTGALTLAVNSLAAQTVYLNGAAVGSSPGVAVTSGTAYSFYFDGSHIQLIQAPSWPACAAASSLGFALNGTDESTRLIAVLASWYSSGGGCLAIDAGKTLRADSQITTPAGAAGSVTAGTAGQAPPYRITGAGGNTSAFAGYPAAPGGSTLDLRYKSSGISSYQGGPKMLAVGHGLFELDHINITTGAASDCATFVMTTGAIPYFHDLEINGAGCNGGIVLGGTAAWGTYPANSPLTTAVTQYFNGYGGSIENVKLNGIGNATAPAILYQSNVNQILLRHWWVSNGGSSTAYLLNGGQTFSLSAGPMLYINGYGTGTNANRSNVIDEGTLEFFNSSGTWHQYTCGISLNNAEETSVSNVGFYDADSSTSAFCGTATAIKSRIAATNYIDVGGIGYTNSTWPANNLMPFRTAGFSFDGAGSALTGTTTRCTAPLPFGGVINQFSMWADQSGGATVTVKTTAAGSYAGPSSAVDISNGGETMSGAVSLVDTTLSGWTYASMAPGTWLQPGSIVCFTLSNPGTITWLSGNIQILEGR